MPAHRLDSRACLGLMLFLACACAPVHLMAASDFQLSRGREHPLVGRVWSGKVGQLVAPSVLLSEVERAAVILLGETHDNPDQHRLQALLLARFLTTHPGASVVFEMLDEGQQSGLSEPVPQTADELAQRVRWQEHGWPDFALYRPVFEVALREHAQIRVGHPARDTFLAGMRGEPTPYDSELQLSPAIGEPARSAMIREIREAHCGHASEGMIEPMLRAQSFRDAWMARALASASGPAALIAGRGHVRKDRAVPLFLARQGVASSLTVAFIDVDDALVDPKDYDVSAFDFVVFTPRVSDESACDRFKREL